MQSSVSHTTVGPDHKYGIYFEWNGIDDMSIAKESTLATDDVHIEYDGESRGANFVFNYSNYGSQYDKVKSYASVRYMTHLLWDQLYMFGQKNIGIITTFTSIFIEVG
ncbi:hypothetical protein ACFSCX_15050 [Bacillus salitolerans]|uniref:Uncharacterized protein n=1 Tax=Bacillus salitolerans TaxID=1437434 RepID=A0ABW4LRZ9_9BACI